MLTDDQLTAKLRVVRDMAIKATEFANRTHEELDDLAIASRPAIAQSLRPAVESADLACSWIKQVRRYLDEVVDRLADRTGPGNESGDAG